MPQLSQIGDIYASQLFWLAIVFALIYFGIGRAMVPKIERTIDDRNGRIARDLAAAEAARATVLAQDTAYHAGLDSARSQALHTTAEAKMAATLAAEQRLKASDAATEAKMAEALARVDTAKHQAVDEIEQATVEAVEQIVARVSGVAVDRSLVERRVKQELGVKTEPAHG
jgi:F-type H+-transporting ATPase subunit b